MRIDFFAKCLAESLVERGVPEKAAFYHVDVLVRTFSEEDLKEVDSYSSPDDFKALSDSLAVMITEKEQRRSAKRDAPDPDSMKTREVPAIFTAAQDDTDAQNEFSKTRTVNVETAADENHSGELTDDGGAMPMYVMSDDGPVRLEGAAAARFAAVTVCSSPLWITFLACVLVLFGLCIGVVCILMGVAFLLVGALAAAGCAAFLVGLIYGSLKVFTGAVGVGIYEIGLGIAAGAAALALGVLTYNFAVITMPYVLRQYMAFCRHCLRRGRLFVRSLKSGFANGVKGDKQ